MRSSIASPSLSPQFPRIPTSSQHRIRSWILSNRERTYPFYRQHSINLEVCRESCRKTWSWLTCAGFVQALNTSATWQYTFFAPSNKAFNNTGEYFETFAKTAKGKWWLGNLIQHHYVPNAKLKTSDFSSTTTRLQTSTYLYVSAKTAGENLLLNNVATVTEGNLPVTNVSIPLQDLLSMTLIRSRASFTSLTGFWTHPLRFSSQICRR